MIFDPVTALAALGPMIVKAGDALVQRYLVPDTVKPANMAELIELKRLDNDKFRILQEADKGGESYKWVEAIRKLQRPAVVIVTLGAFIMNHDSQVLCDVFSTVMFYLFGERTIINKGAAK